MRFKPHAAYRDSGVEWLGEVPAHWDVKRLKFRAELNPSPLAARRLPKDAEVSFVPMEAIGEYGGLDLSRTKSLTDVGSGYTFFANGDVVVAKITPCFENGKGALATNLTNGAAFGTTELHVLRALDGIDRRYLFYATVSHGFRRLGEAEMYGAGGQKRVPEAFVKNLKHPIPPEPEQRAIAAFLDRETARIDALVAKKDQLVELLQEKRTALITRVVTRGLDPTVAMKDSGVEWLGEIPAHWEVMRSKYLFKVRNVRAPSDEAQLTASQQYGVVPQADFMAREGRRVVQVITGAEILKHVEAGDFVISMRSFQGGIEWSPFMGAISSAYVVLAPSDRVWHPFFVHLFKSKRYIQALQSTSALVRDGQALRFENFTQVPLPAVPLSEQQAIAAFLDREADRMNALLGKVGDAIDRLKELRMGLISAAVTGKIDVREEAA